MNITQKPDNWIVVRIESMGQVFHKVFATWSGGYLGGDSWKLNSGIAGVEKDDNYYYFIGASGSVYKCGKRNYGISGSGLMTLNRMIEATSGSISPLDDREDWDLYLIAYMFSTHR